MDLVSKAILKDLALEEIAPKPRRPKSLVDHWSPAVLLERAAYLRKMAKLGDGSASETLKEYPQHCAMLSFRSRDGEVEVHERFADLFFVLAGKATLVTGGVVTGTRMVEPGETRGASIEGGAAPSLESRGCGPCARRHAASDDGEGRRHHHLPGTEGAGGVVGVGGPCRQGAEEFGAGDRDRTGDIQLGKLTFCH